MEKAVRCQKIGTRDKEVGGPITLGFNMRPKYQFREYRLGYRVRCTVQLFPFHKEEENNAFSSHSTGVKMRRKQKLCVTSICTG